MSKSLGSKIFATVKCFSSSADLTAVPSR